jgi:hypothetical protein
LANLSFITVRYSTFVQNKKKIIFLKKCIIFLHFDLFQIFASGWSAVGFGRGPVQWTGHQQCHTPGGCIQLRPFIH